MSAITLSELSALTAGSEATFLDERLLEVLRSHQALGESFRRGEDSLGPPDFVAVLSSVSGLVARGKGGQVMKALSSALRALPQKRSAMNQMPLEGGVVTDGEADSNCQPASRDEVMIDLHEAVLDPPLLDRSQGSIDGSSDTHLFDCDDVASQTDAIPESEPDESNPSTDSAHACWVLVALVATLPLLDGALPRDKSGICVIPHEHRMNMVEGDLEGIETHHWGGRVIYVTHKVCDRCMEPIQTRVFFHCSKDCDVDFCEKCQNELNTVLKEFSGSDGDLGDQYALRMLWSIYVVDCLAQQLIDQTSDQRMANAQLLATECSTEIFLQMIHAVVDICNAKTLYNDSRGALTNEVEHIDVWPPSSDENDQLKFQQQVKPIYDDNNWNFWYSIALLQFLYACNQLPQEQICDGHGLRGPRVPYSDFVLEGINKCNPHHEWRQWVESSCLVDIPDMLSAKIKVSRRFRSLVAHHNLLPISFRRHCMLEDIWHQMAQQRRDDGESFHLVLRVDRDPVVLIDDVLETFGQAQADAKKRREAWEAAAQAAAQAPASEPQAAPPPPINAYPLRKRLKVMFKEEEAHGPGVRKEFFQVAIRAFLLCLFSPTENRTYWFSDVDRPEAFFACGVLLGQAIMHDVLIPRIFPKTLFELLLRDLDSPHSKALTLTNLAEISKAEADSLKKVLEYDGVDIGKVFGDLGWERTGDLEGKKLSQGTKEHFTNSYVQWAICVKTKGQLDQFSRGFREVFQESMMLQKMVDANHLEQIVCGAEMPVDVWALKRTSTLEGWRDEDEAYLNSFWTVLSSFDENTKLRFVVFLTASDRVPLEGWAQLRVVIQKNGEGDVRLPTAFTCFNLLLLPRYSSEAMLSAKIRAAITNSEGFGLQ